jgi:hypothetical protein
MSGVGGREVVAAELFIGESELGQRSDQVTRVRPVLGLLVENRRDDALLRFVAGSRLERGLGRCRRHDGRGEREHDGRRLPHAGESSTGKYDRERPSAEARPASMS